MVSFARQTPAPPSQKESDPSVQALIDEIDAEVKAENFEKFLKRHGKYIFGAIAAVILGTALANAYTGWMHSEQQKETATLITAMDRDPAALPEADLKMVLEALIRLGKNGHGQGIRLAAGLSEASILFQKDQKDAALERLEQLQKDTTFEPLYRDYVLLQIVRARLDSGKADELLARLNPLVQAEDNPWRLSALQLAALLEARQGHMQEAAAKLQAIVDAPEAPLAAREQATQLMRLYKAM
ncbi:MAG: tetratricopeptide repeat protein [Proteobacteria bacterium]|nr:tetratricopeptide repeat protein [Pseudomonadota bacterium]